MPTAEKPDFHIHHHYHAAHKAEPYKAKAPGLRKSKKRRNITSPGFRTPSTGAQTPQAPHSPVLRATSASSAATILSQTSVTVPSSLNPHSPHRWPSHSSQAALSDSQYSVPSSPMSSYRDHSVFDADEGTNSSRPTSPASTTIDSPTFRPRHSKATSDLSFGTLASHNLDTSTQSISGVLHASKGRDHSCGEHSTFSKLDHEAIPEEAEEDGLRPSTTKTNQSPVEGQNYQPFQQMRSRLHRANSAESILSTRGEDIPVVHRKHSQLLSGPRKSPGSSTASVGPVTSSTSAVAHPSKGSKHYDSSSYNRLLLTNANATSTSPTSASHSSTTIRPTLGKKLGGWMTGKWGIIPTSASSTSDLRAKASLSAAVNGTRTASLGDSRNQKAAGRLSTHVEPVKVDNTALEEALEGG